HGAHPHSHPFPTRRSSDLTRCRTRRADGLQPPCSYLHGTGEKIPERWTREPHAAAAATRRRDAGRRSDLATHWTIRTEPLGSRRSEEHTSELQSLAYLVCR